MILLVLSLLFVMLIIGVPIYISLILSSIVGMLTFTDLTPMILVQRTFGGIDKFVLMALPFFILAANAMDVGGLSTRILNLAKALVGHLHGGIGMTTQVASMFFGALSGSSPATVVAIGRIMYPEMLKQGYSKKFSSGLIIQSGSVSLVIPPSITLILYASATNTSVGSLFMAGLGAGIFFGACILAYIYFYARFQNMPRDTRATWRQVVKTTRESLWSLAVPVIILGGMISGLFTATEAAGVSAVYAIFVGMFIYKEITLKKLYDICVVSAQTTAQVMILIAGASALGWLLTVGQFPQTLADFLTANFTTGWTFLLFLNILLLIVGMFVDSTIALVVIAPLILSSAVALGVNPIHLGTIMVLNLAIGTFTPPFGLNIFVSNSVTGLRINELLPGLMRFIIVSLIALIGVTYIPSISTFIPNLVYSS